MVVVNVTALMLARFASAKKLRYENEQFHGFFLFKTIFLVSRYQRGDL